MFNLFSNTNAKSQIPNPFISVEWEPVSGRIIAVNEHWKKLNNEEQVEILTKAPWDFVQIDNHYFVKHIISDDTKQKETIYLLPSDEWYNTLQKLEKVSQELNQTKEQLLGFVQNVPLPLLVMDKNHHKVLFANQLLLNFFKLPLSKLYTGITLEDLFGVQSEFIQALFIQALEQQKTIQEIIELRSPEGNLRYLLLRIFHFKTSFMEGIILGILDLTKEKEQEFKLNEAYNELQAQAEELQQAHDAMISLNHELKTVNDLLHQQKNDLEASLKAAQRFQKKLLLNFPSLENLSNYNIYIEAIPHSYVGGDFFFVLNEHPHLKDWNFFVLGDATGHGPSGALLALTVTMLLKSHLINLQLIKNLHQVLLNTHTDLIDILDANHQIASTEGAELVILALPNHTNSEKKIYFTSAGLPVVITQPPTSSNQNIFIYKSHSKALGWFLKDTNYLHTHNFQTYEFLCTQDSSLFIFSDGLIDQTNVQGTKIGKKRLFQWFIETISMNSPKDKVQHVIQKWKAWKDAQIQMDDIILGCIQF